MVRGRPVRHDNPELRSNAWFPVVDEASTKHHGLRVARVVGCRPAADVSRVRPDARNGEVPGYLDAIEVVFVVVIDVVDVAPEPVVLAPTVGAEVRHLARARQHEPTARDEIAGQGDARRRKRARNLTSAGRYWGAREPACSGSGGNRHRG